jgi:YD repeat-containing protein
MLGSPVVGLSLQSASYRVPFWPMTRGCPTSTRPAALDHSRRCPGNLDPRHTTFAYDADSNLTTETYPNATVGSFTFDAADRMSSTVDSLSGTRFLSLTYHRDADGQLTQGSATQQYGYDTTNRVIGDHGIDPLTA